MSVGQLETGSAPMTLGSSAPRPDALAKALGTFAFSSDLRPDGALWAATLRSPHAHARIASIDVGPATEMPGVAAVITARDVPGQPTYGLIVADQPVFADDVVRYIGQPIAAVAAETQHQARLAAAAIVVTYEPLAAEFDADAVVARAERTGTSQTSTDRTTSAPGDGSVDDDVFRHQRVVHGNPDASGSTVVEGTYELGSQDHAFLGLEAGYAIPTPTGVEIHVATQALHEDRSQIAACLGLEVDDVVVVLGGVGGAFGAREDLSLQIHVALLALTTGRPVRMQYSRAESFVGHVHRHPARIWMRHHATADGELVKVEARLVFDGGAYGSSSAAVLGNAVTHAAGPYRCPNAVIDGWAVRTNRQPCGAMRGFGVVQMCFAHEAQMDRLAAALDLDPVEVRLRNALHTGDRLITNQVMDSVGPVAECLRQVRELPLPTDPVDVSGEPLRLPGGVGLAARDGNVVRGIGYAASIKNLMYSEGADDYSTAQCRLSDGKVRLKFATVEVGQGFITIATQIARTVLGVDDVEIERVDTLIGSAGSSSASRQTWMSGGAVHAACLRVRDELFARLAAEHDLDPASLTIDGYTVVGARHGGGRWERDVREAAAGIEIVEHAEFHHRATTTIDDDGQGDCQTAWAFAAHRAVVDVDVDLGLVRVVQIATVQDVGVALNPLAVYGQIEGGIAQGMGLAVMEELIHRDGAIVNATFTDYLLPTMLDMPQVEIGLIEEYEPQSPLGAKGVGEPPCISSTPAVVAAIRDALEEPASLVRVPVKPFDIVSVQHARAGSSR